MKIGRRSFMKMCGVVMAISPTSLIKGKEPKTEGKEIAFPSCIWNAQTGITRELDMGNPADLCIFLLGGQFISQVDWDGFQKWSEYCNRAKLRMPEIYCETLLDILQKAGKYGNAFMYWDGRDEGLLKVIYGLPENKLQGRDVYIAIIDETYTTEDMKRIGQTCRGIPQC